MVSYASHSPASLPKIAWLSPFPPQTSGIANYSYWLVRALKSYFQIDIYTDAPLEEINNEFDLYPLNAFANRHKDYEEVIYHLGNHIGFHKEIYRLAWNFPGTLVLHDYNLGAFLHDGFYRQNEERMYEQALMEGYGDEGLREAERLASGHIPSPVRFPMSHAVVKRSRKTIVHHRWLKRQLGDNDRVEVIPHFAKLSCRPTPEQIGDFKRRFRLKDDYFIITCLGFINSNKLPWLQVEVIKRLIDDGYPVQMIFAGEPSPDVKSLEKETRAGKYCENIISTGYLDERDYFSAIFASDIIINLRNPSMGEASGTLMHALAAARPTIISDVNQYREFPDKVCWKLTHDESQAEVLYEYISALLADRNLRAAIANNSAEYVRSVLGWDKIIERWVRVIRN